MNQDFPKSDNKFLKATDFQDQELPLTFKGWDKKANEDREIKGQTKTWKQNLKYQLRYSYPQFAVDEAGEQLVGKDGKPFQNKNYDPKFPQGYSILYYFEEGQLESGSLPLWNAFCLVQPKSGDKITIGRTGTDKETKWKVKKLGSGHTQAQAQDRDFPDELPGEESPF